MRIIPAISLSFLLSAPAFASAARPTTAGLRSTQNRKNGTRKLRNPNAPECTILVLNELRLDDSDGIGDNDVFECVLDATDADGVENMVLPIAMTEAQKNILKNKLKQGELISDESTLQLKGNGFQISDRAVHVPKDMLDFVLGKKNKNKRNGRNLAIVEGKKPILAVKVFDVNGLARSENPAAISDDIFGTGTDPVNLKSQMAACSFGKLNITAGLESPDPNEVAPGVIEVSIGISLTDNDRYTIRNAVTAAVQTKLGHSLPGPYQQVMYVLQSCYVGCGWAAYAYINSWNSVYQGGYYKQTGVLMHELGHNFNLAHSGGLDGQTYTDHTGLMGNPLYSDDVGKMCWNAAKTWQIGWYDSNKIIIDPKAQQFWSGTIVGIADFDNNPDQYPVVVKIETGTSTDQFINFNRAKGVNSQNDEADNEVTIVETGNNGEGYSQSYLKAHLVQGEVYTYVNWAGTGQNLVVTANVINISTGSTDYAEVTVCLGVCTPDPTPAPTVPPTSAPTVAQTNAPTAAPTSSPTASPTSSPTPQPTVSPTAPPTPAPTNSPEPTASPTSSPTSAPTDAPTPGPTVPPTKAPTASPTVAPTASPTASPTEAPTAAPTSAPTAGPTVSPTEAPTPVPTEAPTPEPTALPTHSPTSSPTVPPTPAPTRAPTVPSVCDGQQGKKKCVGAAVYCTWSQGNCIDTSMVGACSTFVRGRCNQEGGCVWNQSTNACDNK